MSPVDLVLRLLHIVPAIFLAGGIFFTWFALMPALSGVSGDAKISVEEAVRGKWAKIVMICSGLLLVSGLINAVRGILAYEFGIGPVYHIFVTLKLVVALGVMFISARLSGRSESAAKFREQAGFWMKVNTGLVLALILMGSTMRVSERIPKVDEPVGTATIEVSG